MKKSLVIIVAFACIFGYRYVYAQETTAGGTTKPDIKAFLRSFFKDSEKMIFTSDARINLMGMMVAEGTEEIQGMKDLLGTMEAESVNIEKVEVADRSAVALVTGVKNQEYEKMNFLDAFELSLDDDDEWKVKTLIAFLDPQEKPGKEDPQEELGKEGPQEELGKEDPQEELGKENPQKELGKEDPQKEPGKEDPQEELGKEDPQEPGKEDPQEETEKEDLQEELRKEEEER